jgi:hypothetical protein
MNNRRLFISSLLGIGIVVIVLAVTFIISGLRRGAVSFPLPTPNPETETPSSGGFDAARVEVTRENIQRVVGTLARPESYTREVLVETFWDGGSGQTSFTAAVSPLGASLRSSVRDTQKNIVIRDGKISIWYGDGNEVLTLPVSSPAAPDKYQMLLTYEDILALPASAILDAGYVPGGALEGYEGDTMIYVKYRDGQLGYVTECLVSVRLGLLVSAEVYDGEAAVYRMSAGSCQIGPVDEALFAAPEAG